MKNKSKIFTKTIIMLIAVGMIVSGCSKGSAVADCSEITGIDGVSFSIPTNITSNATAITQISNTGVYDINTTYAYKNANSEYLLFNMEQFVVAVQKGTSFDFQNAPVKEESLTSNTVLGVWFDTLEKKMDYADTNSDGVYRISATVNAEVIVTDELYDNFVGKLVSIQANGEEWTLFVGTKGSDYNEIDKNVKAVIETVAQSFNLKTANIETVEFIEVGDSNSQQEVENEQSSEEPIVASEPETESDEVVIDVEPVSDEVIIDVEPTSDEVIIDVEPVTSEVSEEPLSEEMSETEPIEEEPVISSETESIQEPISEETDISDVEPEKESITLNNQTQNAAASSSIYNMSNIGDTNNVTMTQGSKIATLSITPTELYTDENAIKIIKEFCESGNAIYSYTDAPSGCSWQVLEYEISYEKSEYVPYMNIKIIGLDGQKLAHRGFTYSKRTHDIFISESESNGIVTKKMYCFYAVPNGCTEYALECGDGTIENDLSSAYYYINR